MHDARLLSDARRRLCHEVGRSGPVGATHRRQHRPPPRPRLCNACTSSRPRTAGTSATGGVPLDAQGDAAGAASSSAKPAKSRKPHAPSLSATKDLLNTIIGKPGHVNNGGTPSGTYTTPSQGQAP